ncbi:hypothetical protein EMCRGX_G014286 [Ephydatia muelleri]
MKASSLQVERTMYSLQLNSTGTRGVALANASSPGDLSCEIIISYPDPPYHLFFVFFCFVLFFAAGTSLARSKSPSPLTAGYRASCKLPVLPKTWT